MGAEIGGLGETDIAVALDQQYVERRTALGDFMILLRTIKVVVLRDGAR